MLGKKNLKILSKLCKKREQNKMRLTNNLIKGIKKVRIVLKILKKD